MMKKYNVELSDDAKKALKKMDRRQANIIVSWIEKNLDGCDNPRQHGKPLTGNKKGYWRYRVGAYRIIADIQDNIIQIEVVNVGHRRKIYD